MFTTLNLSRYLFLLATALLSPTIRAQNETETYEIEQNWILPTPANGGNEFYRDVWVVGQTIRIAWKAHLTEYFASTEPRADSTRCDLWMKNDENEFKIASRINTVTSQSLEWRIAQPDTGPPVDYNNTSWFLRFAKVDSTTVDRTSFQDGRFFITSPAFNVTEANEPAASIAPTTRPLETLSATSSTTSAAGAGSSSAGGDAEQGGDGGGGGGGLSTGAKAGVGVGVALGAILFILVGGTWWMFVQRRRARRCGPPSVRRVPSDKGLREQPFVLETKASAASAEGREHPPFEVKSGDPRYNYAELEGHEQQERRVREI